MNPTQTRPSREGRVSPHLTFGAALFTVLAALWCWSIAAPSWGMPVGVGLFVAGMCLLAREDRKESTDA